MSKTVVEFHTGLVPTKKKSAKTGEDLHVYDCPFCGKSQHLYFFPNTTTWDCKVCGRKGNNYEFCRYVYTEIGTTRIDELKEIWELPARVFDEIRYNPLNGTFLIPTFKNAKLNNLYKYIPSQNKTFGTPGIPATLNNWNDDGHEEVWICEGQKDRLAAKAILGMGREITPIALPGANMFRDSWLGCLSGKRVILLFDNDEAGQKGKDHLLNILKDAPIKPQEVYEVRWKPNHKEGFDLYDFYQEHKGSSYKELQPLLFEVKDQEVIKITSEKVVEDVSCDSYDKALDSFEKAYYLTSDMRKALAAVLASIYSINIDGEQVWLKIIGPPGSGKTRIAKALSACDQVVGLSTFTGLFSGWVEDDDKDAGLIPVIADKTLIVKDADALLKQPNIEQIMSELRDFYDKDSAVRYRTGKQYNYQDIRSTFIMMGTQVLRRADQSFLGERLLTMEMNVTSEDNAHISQKALERNIQVALGQATNPETEIRSAMKGWVNHMRARKLESTLPPEFQKMILQMCSLVANMRTQVDRDSRGKLLSPAVPELPTRIIGQIVSTSLSLCVVFGQTIPNEEIFQIIKKILRDTMDPRSPRYEICDIITNSPGITAMDILEIVRYDKNRVYEVLHDLTELKFVTIKNVPSRSPGAKAKGFWLRDDLKSSFQEIANDD